MRLLSAKKEKGNVLKTILVYIWVHKRERYEGMWGIDIYMREQQSLCSTHSHPMSRSSYMQTEEKKKKIVHPGVWPHLSP